MNMHTDKSSILERLRNHSPFLGTVLEREREFIAAFDDFPPDPANSVAILDTRVPIDTRLRIERRRLALLVAFGDLAGCYDLTAVTHALTDFADRAIDTAIAAAMAERTPEQPATGFVAIALGKQGSRELNYSSDVDPIFLYDPETLPRRDREEPAEAAVRIGRRVVELLQQRTGDGYVLRVDLRLRPSPEATPIALPVDAAIQYYESQALPWERAAFIRARPAAGDLVLGERFLAAIEPFIWRRALDYGAVAEIRGITRRIRDHYAQGQAFGPGYDLKRGRGGIREIEFFAQVHQLVHGGRDAALRTPATRDALAALAAAGRIDPADAAALTSAYTMFRTIEHRLQMVDDRQTHMLPTSEEAIDNVARLHGLTNGAALLDLLRPHVATVARTYDALDGSERVDVPADAQLLEDALAARGFEPAAQAVRRIAEWRGGSYPALRSAAARAALEDALPGLLDALATATDPYAALLRLDAMLARLPSAINLFRLLEAQPALAALLGTILCHAPTLAETLARRATLLDGLIDASALVAVDDVPALADRMRRAGAYEGQLDRVRDVVNEQRFALGVQVVAGTADPLDVAAGYARVAEAAVTALATAATADFAATHGHVPDSELVILALGRLGGGALTHASDLDLIYLFTGDFRAESDGRRPLGAVHYYNRLAQRVSAALSVPTAAGPLYEVDTRLRPSGAQGPLVVSLDGFVRYQHEDAWTWEHMALTRSRPIHGSPAARSAVATVIANVLGGTRPARDVLADAVAMRAEMAAHKPARGPLDAKLGEGGLVDLEFAVHVQQLRHHTAFDPDLGGAIAMLSSRGLIGAGLHDAHALLTRMLVATRLVAPDAQVPPLASRPVIARALGFDDWEAAVDAFAEARRCVTAAWNIVAKGDAA